MANSPKIVISMDVGTRMTSVSYLYWQPNVTSAVKRVQKWPGQKPDSTNVPSVMYYKDGKPCAYGGDYTNPEEQKRVEAEKLHVVKDFKRWVNRLETNPVADGDTSKFDPLPTDTDIASIYEAWMTWVFKNAQNYIRQSITISPQVWKERTIVFTVPNGWSEPEESNLRELILKAGCVETKKNIHFVRESDAALRYHIHHKVVVPTKNSELMICDVGRSTTDIALYRVVETNPIKVEEMAKAPAISIEFGNALAEEYYDGIMEDMGADGFAEETHPDPAEEANMQALDNGIKMISDAIKELKGSHIPSILIIEGGFFDDPKAEENMRRNGELMGMRVIHRTDTQGRATADGAIYCDLQNFVTARTLPYAYGSEMAVKYNPLSASHQVRKKVRAAHGWVMPYSFKEMVSPGQVMREGDPPFKVDCFKSYRNRDQDLSEINVEIYACKSDYDRTWVRTADGKHLSEGFISICKIQVDLSELRGNLPQQPSNGTYILKFQVGIDFGAVTSRAIIYWKDQRGVDRSKDAVLIPPDDAVKAWLNTGAASADSPSQSTSRRTPPPSPKRYTKPNPAQKDPEVTHGASGGFPEKLQSGRYYIGSVSNSGRYATLTSNEEGTPITLDYMKGLPTQKWLVSEDEDGKYIINCVGYRLPTFLSPRGNGKDEPLVATKYRRTWNITRSDGGNYSVGNNNYVWTLHIKDNRINVNLTENKNRTQEWEFQDAP